MQFKMWYYGIGTMRAARIPAAQRLGGQTLRDAAGPSGDPHRAGFGIRQRRGYLFWVPLKTRFRWIFEQIFCSARKRRRRIFASISARRR